MHLWINSFFQFVNRVSWNWSLLFFCIFDSPRCFFFHHFLPEKKRKRRGDRRQVTNKKGNVTERRDFAPTATSLTKIRNTISCKEKLVQRIPYSLLDNVRATFPFFVAGIWTSDRHVILLSIKKFRVSHNYHRFEIFISSSHYNYIRYNIIDLEIFHGHILLSENRWDQKLKNFENKEIRLIEKIY